MLREVWGGGGGVWERVGGADEKMKIWRRGWGVGVYERRGVAFSKLKVVAY